MHSLVFAALLLFPFDPPPASPIHWPVSPPPAPTPAPAPSPVTQLNSDQLYVIGLDQPAIVVASPPGIVNLKSKQGPITVHGKFVDGPATPELRDVPNKQVWLVYPIGTGQVELIVTWGDPTAQNVDRRLINVGPATPPTPPTPPAPADPFVAALQTAYTSEPAADKHEDVVQLAALYSKAAKSTVNDPSITTTAAMFQKMHNASQIVIDPAAIPAVRKVIGAELKATLGTPGTLDAASRASISALFERVANALGGLK
jgi:hypothetical protein